MSCQRSHLPVMSNSEKDMKKEMQTINDQLHHLSNGIKQVTRSTSAPSGTSSYVATISIHFH